MRLLALLGLHKPYEDQIAALRQSLQDVTVEKLIAEDRLRSAIVDKEQLWKLMSQSIQDMKVAYQMHINLSWQKQGLPAPYPESPGMGPEQVSAQQMPADRTIPRPMLASEAVALHKKRFIDQYFKGQAPEEVSD